MELIKFMSWNYNFLDHTADIAFEAEADSIEELFTASAFAFKETVAEEFSLEKNEEKVIEKMEFSLEELLVTFIDELNFILQTKRWIIHDIKNLEISEVNKKFKLFAQISGEPVSEKHHLKEEIKAVTFHQMNIKKANNKFITRVVFDI